MTETPSFQAPRELVVPWADSPLFAQQLAAMEAQVTHYFFEGCAYFSPILSNSFIGELHMRDVWNITRQCHVPHIVAGRELGLSGPPDGLQRMHLPGH